MKKTKKPSNPAYSQIIPADVKPPAAPEIEAAILGALMIDKLPLPIDKSDAFYYKEHRLIYEAMQTLRERNEPIDTVTVYEELKKRNQIEEIGGAVYLSKLTQQVTSCANIEYHAKIIMEKAILRGLISSSHEIASAAYSGHEDTFDILKEAMIKINALMPRGIGLKDFRAQSHNAMRAVEKTAQRRGNAIIPTGYTCIDELIHGAYPKETTILGARTGHGKTTVALNIAYNISLNKNLVAIYSFEADSNNIFFKLYAKISGLNSNIFRYSPEDNLLESRHKIEKAMKEIHENEHLYINPDKPDLEKMVAELTMLKFAHPELALVVIDNLQAFAAYKEYRKREDIYKEIIQTCMYDIAKALDVHVLMLAQLEPYQEISKSDVYRRPLKITDLQDIKAGVGEGPDNVLYLYRPEVYWPDPNDKTSTTPYRDKEGNPRDIRGIIEIIPIKLRNEMIPPVKKEYPKLPITMTTSNLGKIQLN